MSWWKDLFIEPLYAPLRGLAELSVKGIEAAGGIQPFGKEPAAPPRPEQPPPELPPGIAQQNPSTFTDADGNVHHKFTDQYGRTWDWHRDQWQNTTVEYNDKDGLRHLVQEHEGNWWDIWTDTNGNQHVGFEKDGRWYEQGSDGVFRDAVAEFLPPYVEEQGSLYLGPDEDSNGFYQFQDQHGRIWEWSRDAQGNAKMGYTDRAGQQHEVYKDSGGYWWHDTWTDKDGVKHVGQVQPDSGWVSDMYTDADGNVHDTGWPAGEKLYGQEPGGGGGILYATGKRKAEEQEQGDEELDALFLKRDDAAADLGTEPLAADEGGGLPTPTPENPGEDEAGGVVAEPGGTPGPRDDEGGEQPSPDPAITYDPTQGYTADLVYVEPGDPRLGTHPKYTTAAPPGEEGGVPPVDPNPHLTPEEEEQGRLFLEGERGLRPPVDLTGLMPPPVEPGEEGGEPLWTGPFVPTPEEGGAPRTPTGETGGTPPAPPETTPPPVDWRDLTLEQLQALTDLTPEQLQAQTGLTPGQLQGQLQALGCLEGQEGPRPAVDQTGLLTPPPVEPGEEGTPTTPSGDGEGGIPGLGVPYQDFIPFYPMVKDPATGQWRNAEPGEIPGAGGDQPQPGTQTPEPQAPPPEPQPGTQTPEGQAPPPQPGLTEAEEQALREAGLTPEQIGWVEARVVDPEGIFTLEWPGFTDQQWELVGGIQDKHAAQTTTPPATEEPGTHGTPEGEPQPATQAPEAQAPPPEPQPGDDEGGGGIPTWEVLPYYPTEQDPATGERPNAEPAEIPAAQSGGEAPATLPAYPGEEAAAPPVPPSPPAGGAPEAGGGWPDGSPQGDEYAIPEIEPADPYQLPSPPPVDEPLTTEPAWPTFDPSQQQEAAGLAQPGGATEEPAGYDAYQGFEDPTLTDPALTEPGVPDEGFDDGLSP